MATLSSSLARPASAAPPRSRPAWLIDCASLAFGAHIADLLLLAGQALDNPPLATACLLTSIAVAASTVGYYVSWRRARTANRRQLRAILRRVEGRG